MKLYAKVTTERASKGQGGNNHLEFSLMRENGTELLAMFFVPDNYNNPHLKHVTCADLATIREVIATFCEAETELLERLKGKQEKGE